MSSAICFNLDQSKMLLSGNELKQRTVWKRVLNSSPNNKIVDWSNLKAPEDDKNLCY